MSYNVFADMGLENPEAELLKCHIVHSLGGLIAEKTLTDDAVAALWNIPASEVPLLLEGDWDGYTLEELFAMADALNRNVNVRRLIGSLNAAHDEQAKTLVLTA